MLKFYEYIKVINEGATFGKTGLYPLGYQGVGQYPPAYLMPASADAIYYISMDDRLQKIWEKEPFKIDHLKPTPIWTHRQGSKKYVAQKAKMPPGKVVAPKTPKLNGKIKPYKITKHQCCPSEPATLPPNLVGKKAEKFGDPCPHTFKMPD
jgi:hypothetical protein